MLFKSNNKCPDFSFCAIRDEKKCQRQASKNCIPISNKSPESELYVFVLKLLLKEKSFQNDDQRVGTAVAHFLEISKKYHYIANDIIDSAISSFFTREHVRSQ